MLSTRNILLAATLATTTTLLGACGTTLSQRISADMSEQNAAYQAWWDQQIAYHRDSNVYFSPGDKEYYYFEDGHWNQAMKLPSWITLSHDDVSFVSRKKLLSVTGNSTDVMAFNPHYQPELNTPTMSSEDELQMTLVDDGESEIALIDEGASEMTPVDAPVDESDFEMMPLAESELIPLLDDIESQVTLVDENGDQNE